jgi:acyl transferase domain-containing protein/acyl carrier protein
VAVDTSCSSTLTALHLAAESLRRGECDAVVVGGVNLFAHPYHVGVLAGLDLLGAGSADGAFAGNASGWTPGEGVGVVLLRPLGAAVRDRDTVHGVIEGTWVAHAGRTGRFTAPNAAAMAESMAGVLDRAGVAPAEVGYVECAAAGASLADAAEVEALGRVFAGAADAVPIGTLKPNIGHLEAAAGLSQLTKVLLQLRYGQLAPTAVSGTPNPLVPLADAPVRVADRAAPWRPVVAGEPLRALVNAFGATGSHAHVVVRSATAPELPAPLGSAGPHTVLVSAESADQLAVSARRLRDHLAAVLAAGTAPDLADVAYTTQVGRVPLTHRLAVTCVDLAGVRDVLTAFVAGRPHPAARTGVAAPAAPPREPAAPATRAAAVERWLAGHPVAWEELWAEAPARVPLPTYPFDARPYWMDEPAPDRREAGHDEPAPGGGSAAASVGDDAAVTRMVEYLIGIYAEASGIPAARLGPYVPLEHYGLNSPTIALLNDRLARDLGERSRTLFFEHPDLAGVATALASRHAPPAPDVPAAGTDDHAIAIVGIAGRYPGAADLETFWENLAAGRDCVSQLPERRRRDGWPVDLMWGGFLDEVDTFDPLLFGITPRDAALMDPQERIFLEVSWQALEDAGYPRERLRARHRSQVAVYAGVMYNEYPFFGVEQAVLGAPQDTGATTGGVANRVSYHLDLRGPSLTVDTMCSSSLTAIHLAVRALRSGECEMALAGAVNLSLHPNKFRQQARMKLAASDRRCHSFGDGGDGFVPGEGAGVVVLKPLRRALADGDRVQAVIRGTAVRHAGRTNGWVVPSPVSEGEVVGRALADAGLAAADIDYLECHATGTALGDPVEVNGLIRVFGEDGLAPGSIPVGSVKSNIGHLEAAAGIAGLTKVLLQFRHRRLVPSLHADRLNPNIAWDTAPFRVQRELADWPPPGGDDHRPRRAGISSFGAGGTIGHLVLEEHPLQRSAPPADGPELVVLSAYDADRLRAAAGRLAAFLRRAGAPALADVAYTLQVGREPLRERLATVVSDVPDLCERLERVAAGQDADVLLGRAPRTADPNGHPPDGAATDPAALGRRWVTGGAVEWERLRAGRPSARVVGLPTYPFARMRCWAPEGGPPAAPPVPPGTPLYERGWHPAPAAEPVRPADTGTVLCWYDDATAPLAAEVARELGPGRTALVRAGEDAVGRFPAPAGWIDLCDLHRSAPDGWTSRLAQLQRAVGGAGAAERRAPLRVLHVTRGLLGPAGPTPDLTGARMAAFVRTLGAEYGRAAATVLDTDLPADRAADIAEQIAVEWRAADPYGEVCYRAGVRHRPWLRPLAEATARWRPDPAATYVVTGGTRGLGALVARHLVDLGATRIALFGRRPLSAGGGDASPAAAEALAGIRRLEAAGARVLVHIGSLSDRAAVAGFLARVRTELGPIDGVVHCAGRGSQGRPAFVHKDLADIAAVLEPKVDGLEVLADECAADRPSFFLLFSSICAVVPRLAAGVSDYAAANAFLDLYAGARQRAGRPEFRSVTWPQWRDSGGARSRPNACAPVGLAPIADAEGLRVLERVLALPAGATVVPCPPLDAEVDPEALIRLPEPPAVTAPVTAPVSAPVTAPVVPGRSPAAGDGPPRWLVDLFSANLGIPAESLDPTAEFGDLGVESVLLAELVQRIEERLGTSLDPSTLLEHPTLERLGEHLRATGRAPAEAAPDPMVPASADVASADVGRSTPRDGRIAVIGLACRFPGAPDSATFWDNLRSGRCAVGEVPPQRWDHRALYHPEHRYGNSISKWGAFVDGIEDFDPDFFGVAEDEAVRLDPGIRMFLECAASTLADAGYEQRELWGHRVGVFAGARMSSYGRRAGVHPSALATDQNFIAARVAHHFNFVGPNLVVDSACSSSLVSVALAVQALRSGDCELALAGGVEVLLDEEPYLHLSAARALSPTGRCHTFDERADGFVPGEGSGAVLLKPLAAALADGDRVHAVIESVAVNNDGHTMGITTPNPRAQADVVRRALAAAGRTADEVGLVEAHGTGTLIGDPIELRALTGVFRESTERTGWCAIGSVKSNVGHLLSAAGIAGLLKAALAVEHGLLPPTVGCRTPNPRFEFAASPFYPNTELRDWPAPPGRRVAGISSFGLGGTNAHLVMSDLDPRARAGAPRRRPLPPPVFRRRRLWLDAERPAGSPAPGRNGDGPPTSSILDLTVTVNGAAAVRGSG